MINLDSELFCVYPILVSKLSKNTETLTKNIYESIILIHPMKQHSEIIKAKHGTLFTIYCMKIKDMNKTHNYHIFERKERF